MAELDRYIPGVPCWIDTTQPDPGAAAIRPRRWHRRLPLD